MVEGSISAVSYAATEKIAYGRDPSLDEVLKVGVTSGVMAGSMKYVAQEMGVVQCFVAGTLVATKAGLVPIEEIQQGDLVWAADEETGENALKKVVRTFRNKTNELVHISVCGQEIVATPGHPFWIPVKGWTKAIDLRAGEILQLINGEYAIVQEVRYETFDSSVFIYNFEVEDFHTYYVGENSVLVHNKCIAKDGDYKAIVNEFNEHEAPHAHILKNGQRIAKVDANGNIIKGLSAKGVQKFVSKHKSAIIDGIREYYPRRM